MSLLTDSTRLQDRKGGSRRSVGAKTNKYWSDSQKIEAVATYLLLGGSLTKTSEMLKIPYPTLQMWKPSEWWKKVEDDIRREDRMQLSNKLKTVMENSWDIVSDRLENGDWVYNQKTGQAVRKPVSVKDASAIAIQTTKLRTEMELTENFTVATEQIEDKLTKLAKAFADLSKGKLKTEEAEPEDIEYANQSPLGEIDSRAETGLLECNEGASEEK
jgi:hypothetical protein